jgi:hypothetical protein
MQLARATYTFTPPAEAHNDAATPGLVSQVASNASQAAAQHVELGQRLLS